MSLLRSVGETATRISLAGTTTTVFGGTGLLGSHFIGKLGFVGGRVIVPYRGDVSTVMRHKVMGCLGQIVPQPCQLWDEDAIRRQLEQSSVVVNMVGAYGSTANYSVEAANEFTAYRIAKIAKEMGVERFIHFSALGASEDSPARYLRSKARSEDIVRTIYPDATIFRPGPVWDLNSPWMGQTALMLSRAQFIKHAVVHDIWVENQPVARNDVSDAVLHAMVMPESVGQTYELFSDRIRMEQAYKYLVERVAYPHISMHDVIRYVPLDSQRLLKLTKIRNHIDLTLVDRVASNEPGVLTFKDLHIQPMATMDLLEGLIPRNMRAPDAAEFAISISDGRRKELENAAQRAMVRDNATL